MAKDSENLVPLEVVPVDLASIERLSGPELLSSGAPRRIEPWTPAAAYLASLSTVNSRRSIVSSLNKAAKILCGKPDWRVVDWRALDAAIVAAVLAQAMGAPSTRNKMLSALKGVARAAFRLNVLPTEDYHRIRDVKGDSGSRELSGRDFKRGEIAELIRVCCDNPSPAGARDGALFTLTIVSGARRLEIADLMKEDFADPPIFLHEDLVVKLRHRSRLDNLSHQARHSGGSRRRRLGIQLTTCSRRLSRCAAGHLTRKRP